MLGRRSTHFGTIPSGWSVEVKRDPHLQCQQIENDSAGVVSNHVDICSIRLEKPVNNTFIPILSFKPVVAMETSIRP